MDENFNGVSTRADFRILFALGCLLLIGNDEAAHRRYSCDLDRMLTISTALTSGGDASALPIVYIRFNPSAYTSKGKRFDPSLDTRYAALLAVIERVVKGDVELKQKHGLNLIYMYYDRDEEGRLSVFADATDANAEMAWALESSVLEVDTKNESSSSSSSE
jgi:hypothetical protein